jgi:hypothetical protein
VDPYTTRSSAAPSCLFRYFMARHNASFLQHCDNDDDRKSLSELFDATIARKEAVRGVNEANAGEIEEADTGSDAPGYAEV